jgi:hypothetical protein
MQPQLDLIGGHHVGPLFVPSKRRGRKPSIRSSARWRFLRRRTPAWADRSVLRALERLARIYTEALGEQYSVDHIVPLNGGIVSGLHCPANVAVALEIDNRMKGNRWWPDMPEQQLELL